MQPCVLKLVFNLGFSSVCCNWRNGKKSKLILHDSHDLIEKYPVGQCQVATPGTLGNWIHFHVLAVDRDAIITLHHLLKQLNLWETGRDCVVLWAWRACARRWTETRVTGAENSHREIERQRGSWRGANIFTQEATWVGAPVWTGGICACTLRSTSQWQAAKQDLSQGRSLCQCKLQHNKVHFHLHLLKTGLCINIVPSLWWFSWWHEAEQNKTLCNRPAALHTSFNIRECDRSRVYDQVALSKYKPASCWACPLTPDPCPPSLDEGCKGRSSPGNYSTLYYKDDPTVG